MHIGKDVAGSCPTDPNVEHLPLCDACIKRLAKGINEPQIVAPADILSSNCMLAAWFQARWLGSLVAQRSRHENKEEHYLVVGFFATGVGTVVYFVDKDFSNSPCVKDILQQEICTLRAGD